MLAVAAIAGSAASTGAGAMAPPGPSDARSATTTASANRRNGDRESTNGMLSLVLGDEACPVDPVNEQLVRGSTGRPNAWAYRTATLLGWNSAVFWGTERRGRQPA